MSVLVTKIFIAVLLLVEALGILLGVEGFIAWPMKNGCSYEPLKTDSEICENNAFANVFVSSVNVCSGFTVCESTSIITG